MIALGPGSARSREALAAAAADLERIAAELQRVRPWRDVRVIFVLAVLATSR